MDKLLADLMEKANLHGKKIHVMGAANVGKSSFINRLLENAKLTIKTRHGGKAGKLKIANRNTPMATVSNLPGTTLDFIKLKLPNGVTMIDTPGLLSASQLTSKVNKLFLQRKIFCNLQYYCSIESSMMKTSIDVVHPSFLFLLSVFNLFTQFSFPPIPIFLFMSTSCCS